jgi:hypothetical protein
VVQEDIEYSGDAKKLTVSAEKLGFKLLALEVSSAVGRGSKSTAIKPKYAMNNVPGRAFASEPLSLAELQPLASVLALRSSFGSDDSQVHEVVPRQTGAGPFVLSGTKTSLSGGVVQAVVSKEPPMVLLDRSDYMVGTICWFLLLSRWMLYGHTWSEYTSLSKDAHERVLPFAGTVQTSVLAVLWCATRLPCPTHLGVEWGESGS